MKPEDFIGKQLDRIDGTKGYSPKNCRWVTTAENARNKRTNVKYLGETATDAARRLGGHDTAVLNRIHSGWPLEKAFTKPLKKCKKKKYV